MCDALLFGTMVQGTATPGLFGLGGGFNLGVTLSTVGSVFNAFSAYNQGKQEEKMANIRAGIAQEQANDAIERGRVEEDAQRRKIALFKGEQRAKLGSQLVELDSGSASDLVADTAMLGELDALTIRNNAQREAYSYQSQAALSRYEGQQAKSRGMWSAAGSLLDVGGTIVDSKWYDSKSVLNQSRYPDGIGP